MSDDEAPQDRPSGKTADPSQDRGMRLKAALKANMAKRKAQGRARAGRSVGQDETGQDQE